jgi:UDP-N-acetylmuramyl tripeptide synthase
MEDRRVSVEQLPHAADARTCPRCGQSLVFDAVFVGHDGHYRCPNDDFQRPAPEIAGAEISLQGLDRVGICADGTPLEVPLGGLYNAYNLLGAFAVGRSLGLDPGYMARRLATAAPAFGRQERFQRDGRRFTILLAKNPTGFNSVLRDSVELARGKRYLIALNDRIADGTDVSWIWDVDFELLRPSVQMIVPAGDRAHDLAVRLKYAGVKAEPPQTDLGRALDRLIELTPEGEHAFLLCTYTAMLDLRALLVRRGWLKPYWAT